MSGLGNNPVAPCLPYCPTLSNVIRACVEQFGRREFIVEDAARYTFRDIESASAELALGLIASGIGKATRVGLLMGNGGDWVTAWWAVARAGAFTVPISTFFQARELRGILARADIDTLLVHRRVLDKDYVALLEEALPGLAGQRAGRLSLHSHPFLRRIVVWGDCDRPWATPGPGALLDLAREAKLERDFLQRVEDQITPADLLIAICTSGSTAEPKIVVHTHGNVVRATNAFRAIQRVAPDDRNYTGMPLFWLGGLNVNLLQAMYEGACTVFARSPRIDDVLEALTRERVTRIVVVEAAQAALREAARERGLDLSFVRRGLFELRDADGNVIPPQRRCVYSLGMTETFGAHGYWHANEALPPERAGTGGRTLPGLERKVVDPETGLTLAHGEVGELHVRGFSLMDGYYKRERSEIFAADGFFPTGDLCTLDEDGFVYFKARRSEMIKTSGANVAPGEVEAALLAVASLKEAMVFGVPDARKGEKVVGVVVPNAGENIDAAALRSRMRRELSSFKVPAEIMVLPFEAVPRTPGGKANKTKVKEMIVELLQGRGKS